MSDKENNGNIVPKTYVYGAVRCVGVLKPVFDSRANAFDRQH